jgi:hypothetical protein
MIVPYLMGGLGNQMFQIAAAYAAAKRNKTNFAINLNLCQTVYQDQGYQGYSARNYQDTFFKNIPKTDYIPSRCYTTPKWSYVPIPINLSDSIIKGYYQSEKNFIEYSDEIRSLFEFPESIIKEYEKIKEKKMVGLHVRLGDYLKYPEIFGVINKHYYTNAINQFPIDTSFLLCTDDFKNINMRIDLPKNTYYSNSNNELVDLFLLSQTESIVIANSSFSWWGAYLGKKKEKVICPNTWFGAGYEPNFQDIYCDGWIKLRSM